MEKRFIIGGYSPHIASLPPDFLKTGKVIGINLWGRDFPCDYWIALDTFQWQQWKEWLKDLDAIKFMRSPNLGVEVERKIPNDAVDFWFSQSTQGIPTRWNGKLRWESSTALAAMSLAIVLGATEIVLYGVDFVGSGRADGSTYRSENFWDRHREPINKLLNEFQKLVPIYKTHPESWLDCPLMEIARVA